MFVGDVNNGRIYRFDLNQNRTELSLSGWLADKIMFCLCSRRSNGNDELYAQDGDDVLEVADFDCGTGFDTVVDFNPNEGDITNNNCEDVRTNL